MVCFKVKANINQEMHYYLTFQLNKLSDSRQFISIYKEVSLQNPKWSTKDFAALSFGARHSSYKVHMKDHIWFFFSKVWKGNKTQISASKFKMISFNIFVSFMKQTMRALNWKTSSDINVNIEEYINTCPINKNSGPN